MIYKITKVKSRVYILEQTQETSHINIGRVCVGIRGLVSNIFLCASINYQFKKDFDTHRKAKLKIFY